SVDFPAPLAPTSPITVPGGTTRSTPEKIIRSACPADSPLAVSTALTWTNLGHRAGLPRRLGREPLSGGLAPGSVAGRRDDPGLVLGSGSVGLGHAVAGAQHQVPGAPAVVAVGLVPFEAALINPNGGGCLERVDDVRHVVAAVDPVQAEEERVQLRSQLS